MEQETTQANVLKWAPLVEVTPRGPWTLPPRTPEPGKPATTALITPDLIQLHAAGMGGIQLLDGTRAFKDEESGLHKIEWKGEIVALNEKTKDSRPPEHVIEILANVDPVATYNNYADYHQRLKADGGLNLLTSGYHVLFIPGPPRHAGERFGAYVFEGRPTRDERKQPQIEVPGGQPYQWAAVDGGGEIIKGFASSLNGRAFQAGSVGPFDVYDLYAVEPSFRTATIGVLGDVAGYFKMDPLAVGADFAEPHGHGAGVGGCQVGYLQQGIGQALTGRLTRYQHADYSESAVSTPPEALSLVPAPALGSEAARDLGLN